MASLGEKSIKKIEQYCTFHFNPQTRVSPDMHVRIMIAEALFNAYQSKRVPITRVPRDVVGHIAETIYRRIYTLAATDPYMARLRDEVGICEDVNGKIVPRPYHLLTNDIEAYNVFRRMLGTNNVEHAKMVYEQGSYELIEIGMKNGNDRALASGLDRLAKYHNNFQESVEDHSNTASTERDFNSDAQLVRADAKNYSRGEIEEMKKRYGAYISPEQVEELYQQDDGSYSPLPGDALPTDDEDYFERVEREMQE